MKISTYSRATQGTGFFRRRATLILPSGSGIKPEVGATCFYVARKYTRITMHDPVVRTPVHARHVHMHYRQTPLTPICLPSSRMIQLQATTSTSCTTSHTQSFSYMRGYVIIFPVCIDRPAFCTPARPFRCTFFTPRRRGCSFSCAISGMAI